MKPTAIRKLDRYLGIPLCFLLTLYDWLKQCFRVKPTSVAAPRKILFIKLTEQGASVLAYSALRRAAELVGQENIYFCVFSENRPILDIMGLLKSANIFEVRHDTFPVFLRDVMRFFRDTRRLDIDTVIDMEFFSRASAGISYLTGAGIRVGCHRYSADLPYRGNLMTHKVQYNPYIHVTYFYALLVESALRSTSELPMPKITYDESAIGIPFFSPSDKTRQKVLAMLKNARVSNGNRIILFNPNASDSLPIRKWEGKRFIELAKRLLARHESLTIVITGGPSERNACEEIVSTIGSPSAISLAGHTTLEELLALYSISNVLVTNDSGPGHFAALTNVRTVVMFGPETPGLFGPLGCNATVIWKKLACSPCVSAFNHRNTPCTRNVCMELINVDEVLEKVEELLGRNGITKKD